MSRADTAGWRLIAAIATAALSMMRLTIISVTSLLHRHLVGGDGGDLPGELVLALQLGSRRMDSNVVLNYVPPFGVVKHAFGA